MKDLLQRKKRPLLLAFCIPVGIMLAAIIYREIYPFGDRCFLRVDMYNQYMPFFTEFHRKMHEGGSLLFSWHAGLGANFIALYAYYLASPVNWLLYFCPEDYIIEFMTVLIVIKIGLCGSSFAWYLKRHFGTESYAVSFFAVFYALSGYLCAYNWNIMWLDCILLAPVVVLGLEELVCHKKPMLYCLSLAASILTNYYISIMLCIFLVLYYGILILSLPLREKWKSMPRFAVYSLLAGGLAGAVLIPGTAALRSTRFDQANFPKEIKFYFNILEILARHCLNVATEIRNDHWPNIYCGAAALFFLLLYFGCKKISWKQKLPRLLLLCFFYLSFSMNLLDFLWHGLNYPDSLPARQSFLYIFMVLTLCFEAYLHFSEFSGRQIAFAAGGAVSFIGLCSLFTDHEDFTVVSFLFTALYLTLYALLLYWKGSGKLAGNIAVVLLAGMVIMETAMNTIETSVSTTSRSKYRADCEINSLLLESIGRSEKGFYRIEEFDRMTKNDGMLAGFPTATLFSSTTNEAMSRLYKRLGMSTSKVFYCYDGATPLSSALLSVGYMFSDSLEITDDFHELLEKKEGEFLYRNKFMLPLGYMVDSDFEEKWDLWAEGNPVEVQNRLAKATGVKQPLFRPVSVACEDGKAYIEAGEGGYIYVYPQQCSTKDITADIAGYEKTYEKVYYPHILDIGWCDKGETVCLSPSGDLRNAGSELKVSAYRIDLYTLRKVIHRLAAQPMQIEAFSDTYVRGTVKAREDGILATSIPNEDGWSAFVDGKEAQIVPFGGAMIGLELTEGEHTVTFTYTPPGLRLGAAVSALCALLLAARCGYLSVRKKAQRIKSGTVSSIE
ncbi:MAG: YfhO family protein [Lachnospiraceae bacterium]|nr:YfhO family protein [Lachnospiraceae bacterium]